MKSVKKDNRPFANLHSMILNTPGISGDQTNLNKLITYLKSFESTHQTQATTTSLYQCVGFACSCTVATCPTEIPTSITLIDLVANPPSKKTNFYFSSFTLYIAFFANEYPLLITEATNTLTGTVFDIYHQGNGLGTQSMSSAQGCFGVFTSGTNNDKDACREPLTEECGDDLDYQCKNSGLYDFINEQPVTSSALPYNCTLVLADGSSNDLPCLQWIDKHFISGTIAVKPSAFAAYGLNAQSGMIESPNINDPHNYKPAEVVSMAANAIKTELTNIAEDVIAKNLIYVYKSIQVASSSSDLIQHLEANKLKMNILLSSSFISINILLSLILLLSF